MHAGCELIFHLPVGQIGTLAILTEITVDFTPWLASLRDRAMEILTLLLVLATFYLGWQTRAMAKQTLEARLVDYEPIIKATLGWIGPLGVYLKIQNVGRGVAKNVEIEIEERPTKGPPRKSFQPLVAPGGFAKLWLDQVYFKELSERFDEITVRGKCKDTLGRSHPIDDTIDLKELKKSIETAPQLLNITLDEYVRDIGKTLEEVDKSLRNLQRQMESGVVIKTVEEVEKERKQDLRRIKKLSEQRQKKEKGM